MTELLTIEALAAFAALTALEVVLGIDNVIFIAILAGKLPPGQRDRARTWGLSLAVVSRVLLVLMIGVIMRLDQPWLSLGSVAISAKDLILIAGLVLTRQGDLRDSPQGHPRGRSITVRARSQPACKPC